MTIDRVALEVHPKNAVAKELASSIRDHLAKHGIQVAEDSPDLVLSLGGDGTMLRAAQVAHRNDALLLGINLGTLGYLSEMDATDAVVALDKVLAGDNTVEERMMVSCDVHRGGKVTNIVGLNEALVERSGGHRLVRFKVAIGGESLAALNADGIIVATPTGSTAYALSAGGPIVSPRAECLVLVPVSAHTILARPFVLAADEIVEITLDEEGADATVTLDGAQSAPITSGDRVVVRRHDRPLRLVRLSGPNFLERLRTKLGLPA